MSLPRICRVPLACMLALGLAPMGGTVVAAPAIDGGAGAVRLCGAEEKTSAYQDLALFQSGDGLSLRRIGDAALIDEVSGAKSAACAKATAANLIVEFAGQAGALLAGPVSIDATQSSFAVLDPVLCESYGFGPGSRTVQLTDTNGVQSTLGGFGALRYDLATRRFVQAPADAAKGPYATCHSFPWDSLRSNPPQYGATGSNLRIFGASFEITGDLLVEMIDPATGNRIGELDVTEGLGFTYQIRVTNVGEHTLSGVRIREFLPQATLTPTVDGGSWTCERETTASCGSGSGAIGVSDLSIAPGQVYTYTVQRTFSSAAPAGASSMVAAAAFVSPVHATGGAEKRVSDNAQPLVLTVVPNQAPSIACTPSNLSGANALAEDGAPVDVSCTATDGDGDAVSSMTLVNAAGGTGFGPVDISPLVRDGSSNTWTFTVSPRADESGSVTLHLRATDEHGAQTAAAYALPVDVAAVNDAPSFDVVTSAVDVFSDGSNPDGWSYVDCLAAPGGGFNCEVALSSFFLTFDGGAANESDQSVTPMGLDEFGLLQAAHCGIANLGEDVSAFFSKRPEVLPASSKPLSENPTYALRFSYRTTATGSVFCDFRFSDSGGGVSAPVRVTFTMQDPPAP